VKNAPTASDILSEFFILKPDDITKAEDSLCKRIMNGIIVANKDSGDANIAIHNIKENPEFLPFDKETAERFAKLTEAIIEREEKFKVALKDEASCDIDYLY
jgi:hypothetical protein